MAPATSTKLTYEDYCLLPDDGRRHEIIDGEHYVNPSPNTKHFRVGKKLSLAIASYAEPRGLGEAFWAPYDVVLSDFNVVVPDIIFVSNARKDIVTKAHIKGAPDLIVEILSPSNRRHDEVVKFRLYATMQIPEYWVVDPERDTVKIYRLTSSGYELAPTTDIITTPLIPGFSLPLRDVFD